MGAEELQNWTAYCALQNDEYRKSIETKIHLEQQAQLSEHERANQLRAFLNRL